MQSLGKISHIGASLFVLTLFVSACSREPEETPDITEAIPLDVNQTGEASASGGEAALPDDVEMPGEGEAEAGARSALPNALPQNRDTNTPASQRTLPDTMEAGNNPPNFDPPKGSKVQRFN